VGSGHSAAGERRREHVEYSRNTKEGDCQAAEAVCAFFRLRLLSGLAVAGLSATAAPDFLNYTVLCFYWIFS